MISTQQTPALDSPATEDQPTRHAESAALTLEKTIMHLSWASQKRLAQELAEFHLTVPQYVALRAIQHEQAGCTMTRLAEASYQVAATMTGIVDRLVEQGLVERQRRPNDRRTLHVLLTSAGAALLEQVQSRSRERIERFFATMHPEEQQHMLSWMQRYLELILEEER